MIKFAFILASCATPALSCHQVEHTVAAALRNNGNGWAVISNEQHVPIGIKSVSSNHTSIEIEFDFDADVINTFIVVVDETLAMNGYFVGSSVSIDVARVSLAHRGWLGVDLVDPSDVTVEKYPWSNIWVLGQFTSVDDSC